MEQSLPALLFLPNLGSWKSFTVVVLWHGGSSEFAPRSTSRKTEKVIPLSKSRNKGRQKTADGCSQMRG